jgi:PilZ domain
VQTENHSRPYPIERKHRRFDLELPVSLSFTAEGSIRKLNATSENVSIGGVLLRSGDSVPPHTHVHLMIDVHRLPSQRLVRLVSEGEVVRVEPAGSEGVYAIAVRCQRPITEIETDFSVAGQPFDLNPT